MRCASLWRPSGFAPSRPHNACHLPFAGEAAAIEEPRDAAAAARFPPLHRANPPDCSHSFPARERRSPLACQSLPGAPVRAPRTRESVPVVATLTPRRAARRCGSDLARPSLSLSLSMALGPISFSKPPRGCSISFYLCRRGSRGRCVCVCAGQGRVWRGGCGVGWVGGRRGGDCDD